MAGDHLKFVSFILQLRRCEHQQANSSQTVRGETFHFSVPGMYQSTNLIFYNAVLNTQVITAPSDTPRTKYCTPTPSSIQVYHDQ